MNFLQLYKNSANSHISYKNKIFISYKPLSLYKNCRYFYILQIYMNLQFNISISFNNSIGTIQFFLNVP